MPYYAVFNRYTDELHYFQLVNGVYQALSPPHQRLWSPEAGLGLGLWQGVYQGADRRWPRFYDASGEWTLTPLEREQQRAERLAARLRALGVEPDT